jgi:hypothetical protein
VHDIPTRFSLVELLAPIVIKRHPGRPLFGDYRTAADFSPAGK